MSETTDPTPLMGLRTWYSESSDPISDTEFVEIGDRWINASTSSYWVCISAIDGISSWRKFLFNN